MTLDVIGQVSIFREKIDRKGDSLQTVNGQPLRSMGFENQYYIKKDFKTNSISKIITNSEYTFLLPIEKLNWEITDEKKKIYKYNCQKATLNYGGRNWEAWFTDGILISDGPYIFSGLPGLIISINDDKEDFNFRLIEVRKNAKLFDVRNKAIKIDWKKFTELAKTYYDNPISDLMQRSSNKKITITDKDGKILDVAEFQKSMKNNRQGYILENNNPIELKYRIGYE